MIQTFLPYLAVAISLVALLYTIRRFRLKRGAFIRGRFTTTSSISCDDEYVSSVLLENLKDRAATIFAIYLRVGYSYYIEIENFEDSPLILRPFETYRREYGPIVLYDVSGKRILLNSLLRDRKTKKTLYLSTSDGKYRVRSGLRGWSPVLDLFRNHMTAVIRPIRSVYKNQAYGSNVRFLVEFKFDGDREEIVPLHPGDHQLRIFKSFRLTEDSLLSKSNLEALLQEQMKLGGLACKSFTVRDLKEWRDEAYKIDELLVIEAKRYGLIRYYLIGRILTVLHDRSLRRKNRVLAREARRARDVA